MVSPVMTSGRVLAPCEYCVRTHARTTASLCGGALTFLRDYYLILDSVVCVIRLIIGLSIGTFATAIPQSVSPQFHSYFAKKEGFTGQGDSISQKPCKFHVQSITCMIPRGCTVYILTCVHDQYAQVI